MADVRYKSLLLPSKWARAALVLSIIMGVVAVLSDLEELSLLNRAQAGESVTFSEAIANDDRQRSVAIVQLAMLVVSGAVFIWWFARAYKNLRRLGTADLRYGTGWAVFGWFIPILGLFRPKQIANDIWRATSLGLPADDVSGWRLEPVAPLLNVWWGAFVLGGPLGTFYASLARDADDVGSLITASRVGTIADALWVVSGVLAFLVVARMTERQEARARQHLRLQIGTSTQSAPA